MARLVTLPSSPIHSGGVVSLARAAIPSQDVSISLINFRSHDSFSYAFERNGSTHVAGPNGAGKSDIYRAIRWAVLPKSDEKVHPKKGPKRRTCVQVTIPGWLSVVRVSPDTSLTVHHNGKTSFNADAEIVLRSLFGSRTVYNMSVYLSGYEHPFVEMTSTKRMAVLIEMAGNDNDKEKILAAIVADKQALEKAKDVKLQQSAAFDALYAKVPENKSALLEDREITALQTERRQLEERIPGMREKASLFSAQQRQLTRLKQQLSAMAPPPSQNVLSQLEKDLELGVAYNAAKATTDARRARLGSVYGSLPVYTSDDLTAAVQAEKVYDVNRPICERYGLAYTKGAISARILDIEHVLKYSSAFAALEKWEAKHAEVARLETQIKDLSLSPQMSLTELLSLSFALSLSFEHAHTWHVHREVESLRTKIGPVDVDLTLLIEQHTFQLANQWVFTARERYETAYAATSGSPTMPPYQVRKRIALLEARKAEILRARECQLCPHCSGKVRIVAGKVSAYDGETIDGDVSAIEREIAALIPLSSMPYPDIPSEVRKVSVVETEGLIKQAREWQAARARLVDLTQTLVPLPEGYVYRADASRLLPIVTHAIGLEKRLAQAREELLTLEKPEIHPSVPRVPPVSPQREAEMQLEASELKRVTVISIPVSSAMIQAHLDYQEAKVALSLLEAPSVQVTKAQITEYQSRLARHAHLQSEIASLICSIQSLSTSPADLQMMESRLVQIRSLLAASAQQAARADAAEELTRTLALHSALVLSIDRLSEMKAVCDTLHKMRVKCLLNTIEDAANVFLAVLNSLVRITFDATGDRIKIVCLNDGIEYGDVKEFSEGEKKLIFMAIGMAFVAQSTVPFLIVDETLTGLAKGNERKVIELLLDLIAIDATDETKMANLRAKWHGVEEIAQLIPKVRKTLVLTDHHCDFGDFDKTLELPGRE